MVQEYLTQALKSHLTVFNALPGLQKILQDIAFLTLQTLQGDKKILFFGNGGSASDSMHLATELTVRYKHNRNALPAIALTTDSTQITAIGNDFGFEHIFARQIEALGQEGDLAFALTTSGQSQNVLKGLEMAQKKKLKTVAFVGGKGLHKGTADHILKVPSTETARIQETHLFLGHILCAYVEEQAIIESKEDLKIA